MNRCTSILVIIPSEMLVQLLSSQVRVMLPKKLTEVKLKNMSMLKMWIDIRTLHKNISRVSNLSNHENRTYACALDHE